MAQKTNISAIDNIGISLLEKAIDDVNGNKQQLVDDMFVRLGKENTDDFNAEMQRKIDAAQKQADYYQSEMENNAISERQREMARQKYVELSEQADHSREALDTFHNNLDNGETVRYTFASQMEYEAFCSDMADQNIYVNSSDAQINGSYMCEIFESDRQAVEVYANNNNVTMYEGGDYSSEQTRSLSRYDETSIGTLKDEHGAGVVATDVYATFMTNEVLRKGFSEAMPVVNKLEAVADFVKESGNIAEGFRQNNGEMPESMNIVHTLSADTEKTLDKFSKDGIEELTKGDGITSSQLRFKNDTLESLNKEIAEKYGINIASIGDVGESTIRGTDIARLSQASAMSGMTVNKMIDINTAFISKHADLVVVNGRADFSVLEKMSETQLKLHGISVAERDLVLSMDKALGLNGKVDFGNINSLVVAPVTQVLYRFLQCEDMADEDLQNAGRSVNTVKDGAKTVYKEGKDVLKVIKEKKERNAIKKATKGAKKVGKSAKTASTTAGKKVAEKTVSKKVADNTAKRYQQMMVAKLSEKFTFLQRMQEMKMALYSKVGETALGQALNGMLTAVSSFVTGTLIPCAFIGAGLFCILCCAVVIVIIIYTGIASLFDIYTGESVAYRLAQTMTAEEEAWHEQLLDTDRLWQRRADYRYDYKYFTLDEYVNAGDTSSSQTDVAGLYRTNDNTMYISPWSGVSVSLKDYCHDITAVGFDGGYAYEIDSNYNLGKDMDMDGHVELAEGYGDPKSGHTSNIKDIIAMADVMFQFDQNGSDDGTVQSITQSEFEMNWTDFTTDCVKAVKFVGASVSSFWDTNAMDEWDEWATEHETTSYHCILAYCLGLFEASHQEKIYWEVVYLPTSEGGDVVQAENIFINPRKNDVKGSNLVYDGSYKQNGNRAMVCPSCYDADGNYIEGSTGCCHIDLHAFAYSDGTNVRYGGLGVKDMNTGEFVNADEHNVTPSGITPEYGNATCIPMSINSGVTASNMANTVFSSPCWEVVSDGRICDAQTSEVEQHSNYLGHGKMRLALEGGLIEGDSAVLRFYFYEWETDGEWGCNSGCSSCTCSNCNSSCHCRTGHGCHCESHSYPCGTPKYYLRETVYEHHCKGHQCGFCGGHLVADIHGIVYSMTDEQWFAFSGEGVGENYTIEGKIDLSTIPEYAHNDDLSNFTAYNHHGADKSVTYLTGINLNDHDYRHESWQSQTSYLQGDSIDTANLFLSQDIFDVDMAILYGSAQFPIRHFWEYEGWTQENMQMACAKASADWKEYYEFDIPINMGMGCLAEGDISNMMLMIENTYQAYYGEEMPEHRVRCVEEALKSVGRGNYSQAHHGHLYRTNLCQGHECNKTDCSGFASYCANKAYDTKSISFTTASMPSGMGSFSSCWSSKTVKAGDFILIDDPNLGRHVMVFCGFIDRDACYNAGLVKNSIAGYKLPTALGEVEQLVPITVDCTSISDYGNIYLQNCITGGLKTDYIWDSTASAVSLDAVY